MDDETMITRALRAYFRKVGEYGDQPSLGACDVERHDDAWYVVLRNAYRPLAVYAVKGNPIGDYRLVGLKELPEWLLEETR